MTNISNLWIKRKFKQLRKSYRNQCFLCEKKAYGKMDFAHIKPTQLSGRGRGRKERYYDIIRNPASYMLLCRRCHRRHDSMQNMWK